MLTTSATPNQLFQERPGILALLWQGTQFLGELRAGLSQSLTRDSQKHELRLTGAIRRAKTGAEVLGDGAPSQVCLRPSSWGQVSALTLSRDESHFPTPQPAQTLHAIGTLHTHPHPVRMHSGHTPCIHNQHPSSTAGYEISHSHFTLSQ